MQIAERNNFLHLALPGFLFRPILHSEFLARRFGCIFMENHRFKSHILIQEDLDLELKILHLGINNNAKSGENRCPVWVGILNPVAKGRCSCPKLGSGLLG